ncbi:hypothetical protein E4U43_003113 [Claviceps pusilla]|uniref:Uncharacterized protein n=1 Tax=Claviceps pusilla TaxID=123648 RepID=A0A9P7NFM3_9HYPO|nr:hypothetical protein E4U43_003113 [Claviceps pusilla]
MVVSGRGQDLATSVFSPSSARIAAYTAKDWSFVDSWLSKILPNENLPNYERTPATLAALLTLASVNEATATDRGLLFTASKLALTVVAGAEVTSTWKKEIPYGQNGLASQDFVSQKVTNCLTREGQVALGALADISVQRKIFLPTPENLGRELVILQTSLCETEQIMTRINGLHEHLILELQSSKKQLAIFESAIYTLPIEVPKQNLELQRKTRLKAKQMSDVREHCPVIQKKRSINLSASKET